MPLFRFQFEHDGRQGKEPPERAIPRRGDNDAGESSLFRRRRRRRRMTVHTVENKANE